MSADRVQLNKNEIPASLSRPHFKTLRRYPDARQAEIRQAASTVFRLRPEQIVAGNGSDEIIDLIQRRFGGPNTTAVICPPTFGMYEEAAGKNWMKVRKVGLIEDFQLDVPELKTQKAEMLFLADPNNPTGNRYRDEDLREVIESFSGLVVLDEAYVEFAGLDARNSSRISWIQDYENLIILRTLSKAWGIAGARVGFAFAQARLIRALDEFRMPYNLGTAATGPALRTLSDEDGLAQRARKIQQERERLETEFEAFELVDRVFPSEANFLLVRFKRFEEVRTWLRRQEVIVRDRSNEPGCEDCLRITVGSASENDALIKALQLLQSKTANDTLI